MSDWLVIFRNLRRHPLRSALTVLGVAVALFSFCIIRTMIDAWYTGVRASAKDRLVVRNRASLVFYLPIAYRQSISQVPGVLRVGYGNWFGGVYKDETYRFAQFAIDDNYLDIYREYLLTTEEREAFAMDKAGAILGEEIAQKFGLKVGDRMQIKGTIFPGMWDFTVRGVFKPREENTRTQMLFFHWDYLNERNKIELSRPPDQVGFYVVELASGADSALVSKGIDERFANSYAETITETETAFQQSFVSMSSTILTALNAVSGVVLVIMLLVLANTMIMSARERTREFSILKALGFGASRYATLIFGESLALALAGFVLLCIFLGIVFSIPGATLLGDLTQFFPSFNLDPVNLMLSFLFALLVGLSAGAAPVLIVAKLKVIDGLRRVG